MIKILDSSKDLKNLVNDKTNGLGQIEAISCLVSEELNGIYECDITMLATDKHFSDLSVGGILSVPVSETNSQLFRVYYIGKPINEVVEIKAQHITYDLNKTPVKPFSATGAVNAKNGMINNILGNTAFTMTTDITNTTSKFTLDIPRSFRECLGGYEGSLLDVFRGEYEWDNLTVKMLAKRGSDNGVRIAYGKNLTDFKQEENIENVYTSVLGYAVVNEKTYTGNVYHKVSSTYPKVKIVDFSSDYENEQIPTTAQLTTKASQYATNNDIEVPNVNLTISFVPLYQTEEYKDIAPLERVSLGDTVHVYFEKLNVEAKARVIKTVWNSNLNRYDSIELGNAKANLNTILNEVVQESKSSLVESQSFLESQLNEMASLIINGLGLHKTLVDTGDGAYRIYLHNKSTLAESDTQYIFTSEGFLVSTDYGQTWNAGFDSSGNAVLNSLATITLKALEINGSVIRGTDIYGTTITFGNENGQNVKAYTSSNGVRFDGTGPIFFQTTNTVSMTNRDSNNNMANLFQLNSNSSGNYSFYQNYNKNSGVLANTVNGTATTTYNRLDFNNYDVNGNSSSNEVKNYTSYYNSDSYTSIEMRNYETKDNKTANLLLMSCSDTQNSTSLYNYDPTQQYYINRLDLNYDRSTNKGHISLDNAGGASIYLDTDNIITLRGTVKLNAYELYVENGFVKAR